MAGSSVEIEMRLDGSAGTWFVAHGRVARVRAASHSLVVALEALPQSLAVLLAAETGRARFAPIEVMVIDGDRTRRAQLSEAFRAEGCHVVEAGTTLEALDSLTVASFVTDVIAVADTTPERVGTELLDYLATAHTSTLVVGMQDPDWSPHVARLAPSDVEGVLRDRVRSLLLRSEIREHVERASPS
jgi:CheY-like chemotaxis protein